MSYVFDAHGVQFRCRPVQSRPASRQGQAIPNAMQRPLSMNMLPNFCVVHFCNLSLLCCRHEVFSFALFTSLYRNASMQLSQIYALPFIHCNVSQTRYAAEPL